MFGTGFVVLFHFACFFSHTANGTITIAARVTPTEFARKSIQSPDRVVVQYACKSSSKPPIRTGRSHAKIKSLEAENTEWFRKYSIHITLQVPPYITKCTHLSANSMVSKCVSGIGASESTQIATMHKAERGYFLVF